MESQSVLNGSLYVFCLPRVGRSSRVKQEPIADDLLRVGRETEAGKAVKAESRQAANKRQTTTCSSVVPIRLEDPLEL